MRKEFFINLLFLLFINVLIKPFYIFGIDRTVQNTVADGDYGIYLALLNFTFLFQIINDFGIQQFNNRNIAQYNQLIEKYFPNILILKMGLSMIYCLLIGVFGWSIGYLPTYQHIFWCFVYNQILVSLIFFLRSNIAGLGFYRTDSVVSVLDRLILIVLCSVLLWGNIFSEPFQIEWFIYAQSTSLTITGLIAFGLIFRKLRYLRFRFNYPFLVLILKKSYPYALIVFLMTAFTRVDVIMLDRLLPDGKFENDVYGAGFRLLDAANMLGFLFASLLLPMFSKMIKEKASELKDLFQLSFELILCLTIPLALGIFLFRNEIMILLYDNATPYWGTILGYLILNLIPFSGIYIAGTLLLANGNHWSLIRIYALGFIANLGLNMYLIFTYKAIGASFSTLTTQFGVWILLLWLLNQKMNLNGLRKRFLFLLFSLGMTFMICYFIKPILTVYWGISFLVVLTVLSLIPLIYLVVSFDFKAMMEWRKG